MPVSVAPAEVSRHAFTADAVLRMVAAGILDADDPLELLDGELIVESPQGPPHSALVARIRRLLEQAFGDGAHVRDHSPLHLGDRDLPEPDLAVVRGDPDQYLGAHPTGPDVLLVVEISVSSQRVDRAKAAIYARAGVPTYWNVDVGRRRVTVHERPQPADAEYGLVTVSDDEATLALAGGALPVARLLP